MITRRCVQLGWIRSRPPSWVTTTIAASTERRVRSAWAHLVGWLVARSDDAGASRGKDSKAEGRRRHPTTRLIHRAEPRRLVEVHAPAVRPDHAAVLCQLGGGGRAHGQRRTRPAREKRLESERCCRGERATHRARRDSRARIIAALSTRKPGDSTRRAWRPVRQGGVNRRQVRRRRKNEDDRKGSGRSAARKSSRLAMTERCRATRGIRQGHGTSERGDGVAAPR